MLLHVIAQLPSGILESILQFFLLSRAEIQIRCESLHFHSDLLTYFWCQIHHLLLFLAIWRLLILARMLYADIKSSKRLHWGRRRSHPSRSTMPDTSHGNRSKDDGYETVHMFRSGAVAIEPFRDCGWHREDRPHAQYFGNGT
jgi:hypothetical protein